MPIFKRNFPTEDLGVMTASALARIFSIMCYFPFEYRATILQGETKFHATVGKNTGRSAFSSLYSIAGRDIIFTAMFWPIVERSKKFLKENTPLKREGVIMPLSSIIACILAGSATYPWDLVKTMRVSFELEYKGKGFVEIFKDMHKNSGVSGMLSGKNSFF